MLLRRNSQPLPINISASRIHAPTGTLGLIVVRDISDRKQAEQALLAIRTRYDQLASYREEIKRDGKAVAFAVWVCLRGDRVESFPHHEIRGGQKYTVRKVYSPPTAMKTAEGIPYQVVRFSNLMAKNALAGMMAGSRPFGVFHDHSEAYGAQMASEAKMETSPGKFTWVKVNKKGKPDDKVPNHEWDCETEQIVMANMRGVLTQTLEEESAEE